MIAGYILILLVSCAVLSTGASLQDCIDSASECNRTQRHHLIKNKQSAPSM